MLVLVASQEKLIHKILVVQLPFASYSWAYHTDTENNTGKYFANSKSTYTTNYHIF